MDMDRYSMVPAKTFVLKTNIHCTGCEKMIKKLLQSVGGVHKIAVDAEQGKIEILGTIDPRTVLKLLRRNGKKSELLWDPKTDQNDLKIIPEPKSPVKNRSGFNDKDMVTQVQKLSEIEGVESVEITEKGMKVTFHKDFKKVQDFDDKDDETCCARNSHGKGMQKNHENDCDDNFNHEYCCSKNHRHCCHDGCRPTIENAYMGSHNGSVSTGIPWPGYKIASAPPAEAVPLYYQQGWPAPDHMAYNHHPIYSTFSDDNTKGCVIM